MSRIMLSVVVALVLLVSSNITTHAEPAPPAPEVVSVRLAVELTDGSRLIGDPLEASAGVKFRAVFGKIDVSFKTLKRIELGDDLETGCLHFQNGDRLTGFFITESLSLKTVLGDMEIPWSKIKSCEVNAVYKHEEQALIDPVSHRANGQWSNEYSKFAIDGNPATKWSAGGYGGWYEVDLGALHPIAEVRAKLVFSPAGSATHHIYVSDKPIGINRGEAKLVKTLVGSRSNGQTVAIECPADTVARYVQIHCTHSISWFGMYEFEVFSRADDHIAKG